MRGESTDFGIAIEDLGALETPITKLADVKISSEEIIPNKDGTNVDTPQDRTELDTSVGEGLSLEFLEGGETEVPDTKEKKTVSDKGTTQAPASQSKRENSSQSDLPLSSIASVLNEAGVLTSFTDEELENIGTVEDLTEAMSKQIQKNELKDLNDTQKTFLEALRVGVPQEEFTKHEVAASQYNTISDSDITENVDLQKELIKRSLVIKGIASETAAKLAETISANEADSIIEATTARDVLVNFERNALKQKINDAKALKDGKLAEEETKLSALKSKINETPELFPGIKVNASTKEKIFESMISPVEVSETGAPINELMKNYQEDPEFRFRLHAMALLTKNFTSVTKFTNNKKSSAIADLESKMANNFTGNFGKSLSQDPVIGKTTKSLADSLNRLELSNGR